MDSLYGEQRSMWARLEEGCRMIDGDVDSHLIEDTGEELRNRIFFRPESLYGQDIFSKGEEEELLPEQ